MAFRDRHATGALRRQGDPGDPLVGGRLGRVGRVRAVGEGLAEPGCRFQDRSQTPDTDGIPAEQSKGPMRQAGVRGVVHRQILRPVDHQQARAAGPAVPASGPTTVDGVVPAEVEERVLELGPLDVADPARRDVHLAAGRDAVPGRGRTKAAAVDVVEPLGVRQAAAIVAAVEETGAAQVPEGAPRGVDVVVVAGREEHLRQALADRLDHVLADPRRAPAGRRKAAVERRAFRDVDPDGLQATVAPRYVPEELVRQGDRDVGGRARQGRVLVTRELVAGTREIKLELVAALRRRADDLVRIRRPGRVVPGRAIDPAAPDPVRDRCQLASGHRLRIGDQFRPGGLDEIDAELPDQGRVAARADDVGRRSRLDVHPDVVGVAALLDDGLEDVLAEHPALDDLEAQDPDPLVEDLGGGAAQDPAGVGGVGARGNPADPPTGMEDRRDLHDVVGVRARDVRVVDDELVALVDPRVVVEPLDHPADRIRGGGREPEMAGAGQDHRPGGVVERAHALAALGDDRRGGHPLEGDPALLPDRPQPMGEDLVVDGVDPGRGGRGGRWGRVGHVAHGRITRLRWGSTDRLAPGGTTTVVKGDSTIAGPSRWVLGPSRPSS